MIFLRPLDYAFSLIAVAIAVASAFFVYGGGLSEPYVQVSAEHTKNWEYPLSAREICTAEGPLGETIIEIKDGKARIISSPCENKTCIAMGAIDSPGHFAACLPNFVIVTIEGRPGAGTSPRDTKRKNEIDAVVW
ncbi:MAG: NusG domain II-containing protein [Spirochaetaceae bacterium]|nr:NusG domain II-containing protein [Spirochaetaceae bacterium]